MLADVGPSRGISAPSNPLDWYLASTVRERVALLRAGAGAPTDTSWRPTRDVLGGDRLAQWRGQAPFDEDHYWALWLVSEKLSDTEAAQVFAASPRPTKRDASAPAWLRQLEEAFGTEYHLPPTRVARGPVELAGFLHVAQPLLSRARCQLRTSVRRLEDRYDTVPFVLGKIEPALLQGLLTELIHMVARTLILEIRVASMQRRLQGEMPADRFTAFVNRLCDPKVAHSTLGRYPVLARLLTTRVDYWRRFMVEVLTHLCEDWQEIRSRFRSGLDPGELLDVKTRLGDSHRHGRSVLSLEFTSGLQLVYKPRSLAVDVHFAELIDSLTDLGWYPALRTPRILSRREYGWTEFVKPEPCDSLTDVRRFYERQGGYLALLYAVEGTDLHSDNVIAQGEDPMLVDLEALFQPAVTAERQSPIATERARQVLGTSVLRVGLLPFRTWHDGGGGGVDISGLGAEGGELSPVEVPLYERIGTDRIGIARSRVPMARRPNRPTLRGAEVDLADYSEYLLAGFSRMYEVLLSNRAWLLGREGPIRRFRRDEVRSLFRETQTYGVLLYESYHPDVLQDALDRELLFASLWVEVPYRSHLAVVIAAERDDLARGDLPLFTTRPGRRGTWSSSGELLGNVFAETGMARVGRRIRGMSRADLDRQAWFVRASLAARGTQVSDVDGSAQRSSSRDESDSPREVEQGRLLGAACAIGDRLESIAVRGRDDAAWLGFAPKANGRVSVAVLGPELYDGTAGIALFLALLGVVTGEERYSRLARAAIRTLEWQLDEGRFAVREVGGFSGWGGMVFALTHLGTVCELPHLIERAEAIATRTIPALIEGDRQYDVIGGSAGCIPSLLALYVATESTLVLETARKCGEHLVRAATPVDGGVGWINLEFGKQPLTGYSHGAAGIAWALLKLARVSDDVRFEVTARDALGYERALFVSGTQNWPDMRDTQLVHARRHTRTRFMTTWCHGAPGIGLSRLDVLSHDDAEASAEIQAAVANTISVGFGANHSLCHGDLGNLEFVSTAARALADPKIEVAANRLAADVLAAGENGRWRCGTPAAVECPGLMTGLAGIGYGLLRLAAPEIVPSVLLLSSSDRLPAER
jgi:type 2 lantibiotic biosynthesis protein LanM